MLLIVSNFLRSFIDDVFDELLSDLRVGIQVGLIDVGEYAVVCGGSRDIFTLGEIKLQELLRSRQALTS